MCLDEANTLVPFSFIYLHSIKTYSKKRLWPRLTWVDLVGGHWTTTAPGSSIIFWYNMILRKLEWSEAYSRNRKHFNISPSTYNGEGDVIDLTLGRGIQNPRYANFRLWWPYQIVKVVKWSTASCGWGTISKYFWGWVTWPDVILIKEQLLKIWRRCAPPFSRYRRKTAGGRLIAPPRSGAG